MRKRIALLLLALVLVTPGCAVIAETLIDAAFHDHDRDERWEQRRRRQKLRRKPLGPPVPGARHLPSPGC